MCISGVCARERERERETERERQREREIKVIETYVEKERVCV